jgi:hypothetical protein
MKVTQKRIATDKQRRFTINFRINGLPSPFYGFFAQGSTVCIKNGISIKTVAGLTKKEKRKA